MDGVTADRQDGPVRSILIVGGGTAGWMAAAMLARALTGTGTRITLVESEAIGTVGVGEATIPPFIDMLQFLDIRVADFIRHTEATIKLAIRFDGWNGPGSSYWHPFGTFGTSVGRRPFHHALLTHRAQRGAVDRNRELESFNLCAALARRDLAFAPERVPQGARYALHCDAVLVARYLRQYAEALGVVRIAGTVVRARRDERGMLAGVDLEDGRQCDADLFVDASGFAGVLIERELQAGYIDWRVHLPCDRALAVQTPRADALPPYTVAQAETAGWRWRIPLQHRCGNGLVYASDYQRDEDAAASLREALGLGSEAGLRQLRFVPGRRRQAWIGNCVAIGLAAGFLEPLESTSIHLIMAGVFNLLDHFPSRRCDPALAASYNAELAAELEQIRDFLVLHYALTSRRDSAFWRDRAAAARPDSLNARIALYEDAGTIRSGARDLFTEASWFYVFDGMGVTPRRSDPLLTAIAPARLEAMLAAISRDAMAGGGVAMPHAGMFPAAQAAMAG